MAIVLFEYTHLTSLRRGFAKKRKITNKKYVQIRTNKNGGEHKSFYKKDCPPYEITENQEK